MTQPSITPNQSDAESAKSKIIPNHPLAAIAGKFDGEAWEITLEEIQRLRRLDREQWQKVADAELEAG
jgi:hypothetical protein